MKPKQKVRAIRAVIATFGVVAITSLYFRFGCNGDIALAALAALLVLSGTEAAGELAERFFGG